MRRSLTLIPLVPCVLLLAACGNGGTTAAGSAGSIGTSASASPSAGAPSGTAPSGGAPSGAPSGGAPSRAPRSGAPATPAPGKSAGTATLTAIGLSDDDLAAAGLDGSFALIQGGGSTAGATLDACAGTFPSEALRTGRHQVSATITETTDVSSEVVSYQSAADALQALKEETDAAKGCSTDPHTLDDGTSVTFHYTRTDTGVAGLPASDNLVLEETITSDQGSFNGIAIFQVSGTTLDGTYLNTSDDISDDLRTTATTLAKATGNRLLTNGGAAA